MITGIAVFVGSSITNKINYNKYEVFVIDNFSNIQKKNINKNIKFIEIDISKNKLKKTVQKK